MICTVFPTNVPQDLNYANWMVPQEFPTMDEARAWQKEIKKDHGVESIIETSDGECD